MIGRYRRGRGERGRSVPRDPETGAFLPDHTSEFFSGLDPDVFGERAEAIGWARSDRRHNGKPMYRRGS